MEELLFPHPHSMPPFSFFLQINKSSPSLTLQVSLSTSSIYPGIFLKKYELSQMYFWWIKLFPKWILEERNNTRHWFNFDKSTNLSWYNCAPGNAVWELLCLSLFSVLIIFRHCLKNATLWKKTILQFGKFTVLFHFLCCCFLLFLYHFKLTEKIAWPV